MTTEPAHFALANTAAGPGDGGGGGGSGGVDGTAAAALPRVGKRGAPQAFARKLFEILTTESHAVIAWNDDGTAFHVKDVESFSEETLTKYYRHSKFSSFQRQLNLYSFRKIVKGPDAGGYAHPMFRRDKPDDLYHVRRSISGSSRYEPPTTQVSAGSAKGAASAARRTAGRAGAKATAGSEWAPSRAHKSGGAARRVGKLRHPGGARVAAASSSARRADHRRKQQPPPAAAAIPAQAEEASAGERSPWTSGESSDSDVSIKDAARGTGKQQQKRRQRQQQQQRPTSDESDSDLSDAEQRDETNEQDQQQDVEEEGEEEQQQQQGEVEQEEEGGVPERRTSRATAGLMAAWRRGESSLGGGEATKREQQLQRSKRFSCAAAAEKEAGEGAAAAAGSNGGGLKKGGSGGLGEGGQDQGAPASPARKSPFNFFKKTFSFMERVRGSK